ncbi:MAG: hypothetical protein WAL29_03945 [Bacteroidales bacterium]
MKARSIFLTLALIITLCDLANAQGGILRRAINRQIDNKIDSAIDKSAKDKANESTQENSGTKATGRGLLGGKIDIKYEDEYKFTGRLYMQMETYDKKDVVKSDFFTYFNSNALNAGIEVKPVDPKEGEEAVPAVFIFDNDNRCFLMLLESEDSKTGIISTLPDDSTLAAKTKSQKVEPTKPATPATPATITKTGNTRMIAGYRCEEYKVVEPEKDGYSNVWMSKDVKIKADKKYWGKAGMPTYYNYPGFEGSMMLAMESFDKNNKPEMKMETKEINDNFAHAISTSGYTFMKMNFGQAGKK